MSNLTSFAIFVLYYDDDDFSKNRTIEIQIENNERRQIQIANDWNWI